MPKALPSSQHTNSVPEVALILCAFDILSKRTMFYSVFFAPIIVLLLPVICSVPSKSRMHIKSSPTHISGHIFALLLLSKIPLLIALSSYCISLLFYCIFLAACILHGFASCFFFAAALKIADENASS
jgi:hypothetical protein